MESIPQHLMNFEQACRQAGLKMTHQRLEIFRELLLAHNHPTAESLHRRLRNRLPTISLDTVYRTLSTLAVYGLVNRVGTPESLARFEAAQTRHHHLICRRCGQIVDFQWPLIDDLALPNEIKSWGQIERKNVIVSGLCQNCLKLPG